MDDIKNILEDFKKFNYTSHQYPNPIGLWPNEQECFVWSLLQSDPNKTWVEIGAFCGGSAVLMSLVSKYLKAQNNIVSVDVNFEKWGSVFDYNVYTLGNFKNCHKLECHSWDFSQNYTYGPISFAFIDGWHSFASILIEFEQLDEYIDKDGFVAFHDASKQPYEANELEKYLKYANENFYYLISEPRPTSTNDYHGDEQKQNFYVDEAIAYILDNYNYELVNIPVMTQETHFDRAPIYRRGTTSPYNAFVLIRKIS